MSCRPAESRNSNGRGGELNYERESNETDEIFWRRRDLRRRAFSSFGSNQAQQPKRTREQPAASAREQPKSAWEQPAARARKQPGAAQWQQPEPAW
jgi:hypothetical protein